MHEVTLLIGVFYHTPALCSSNSQTRSLLFFAFLFFFQFSPPSLSLVPYFPKYHPLLLGRRVWKWELAHPPSAQRWWLTTAHPRHTHTHKLSLLHAHTHTWCADTFMPGIKETCKSQSLSLSVRIQRANTVIISGSSTMCPSPPDMMRVARCFVFVSHWISRFISTLTPALAWHSLTCCDNPTNLRFVWREWRKCESYFMRT